MATSFSDGRNFSNISAISWRPVLVVEEAEHPERTIDHGQATGKLYQYPERTTDRRPVLVVEEARVPGENHRPGQATGQSFSLVTDHGQATGKLYHLRYFSYIMATSFSGGRSRSIWREPPTMGKQLVFSGGRSRSTRREPPTATSFSGGRSQSTWREPPTRASNWSTALSLTAVSRVHPFLSGANSRRIGDRLV